MDTLDESGIKPFLFPPLSLYNPYITLASISFSI